MDGRAGTARSASAGADVAGLRIRFSILPGSTLEDAAFCALAGPAWTSAASSSAVPIARMIGAFDFHMHACSTKIASPGRGPCACLSSAFLSLSNDPIRISLYITFWEYVTVYISESKRYHGV
jgi:hypothetical protein